MAVYAVKSEPFDNSDSQNNSRGICVSYNGRPLEIHIVGVDSDTSDDAVDGLTQFVYSKLVGTGF